MTQFATIDGKCEAEGHPSNCQEIVSGSIISTGSCSISINNSSGVEKEIATTETADLKFDSHSHDYSIPKGCHQDESHTLDPDVVSTSVTYNTANGKSSNLYLKKDAVATDPTSGGNINITTTINNSLSEQP